MRFWQSASFFNHLLCSSTARIIIGAGWLRRLGLIARLPKRSRVRQYNAPSPSGTTSSNKRGGDGGQRPNGGKSWRTRLEKQACRAWASKGSGILPSRWASGSNWNDPTYPALRSDCRVPSGTTENSPRVSTVGHWWQKARAPEGRKKI